MDRPSPGESRQLPLFPDTTPPPTLREAADAIRAWGLEGLAGAIPRADQARYQEIRVRSALVRVEGMGFRWSLNPYRGCTHACEYCFARKYQRHLELGAGDEFSTVILVKRNVAGILSDELSRPTWNHETVAVGTATDPYQPIEGRYRLTRSCLEALVIARTPFSIVTKGPLVIRDLDVLAQATGSGRGRVFMSVPTVDEEAWSALEPGTAPPSKRLQAARRLSEAGVETGILMMPLVPGLTTSRSSIERTMAAIAGAGLPLAGADVARFDPGVREHFFGFLERTFPALLEGYERLYAGSRAAPAYVGAVRESVAAAARRFRRGASS